MFKKLNLLFLVAIATSLMLSGAFGQAEIVKSKKIEVPKVSLGVYVEVNDGNVMIREPVKNGPAQKAGLLAKDRFIKIGKTKITTIDDIKKAMAKAKPGVKLVVSVLRDGKKMSFKVNPRPGAKVFKNVKTTQDFAINEIKPAVKLPKAKVKKRKSNISFGIAPGSKKKSDKFKDQLSALGYVVATKDAKSPCETCPSKAKCSGAKATSSCGTCPSKAKCSGAKAKSSCDTCPSKAKCSGATATSSCGTCPSKSTCKTQTFTLPGDKGYSKVMVMTSDGAECDLDFTLDDFVSDSFTNSGKASKKFIWKNVDSKKKDRTAHSLKDLDRCEVVVSGAPKMGYYTTATMGSQKGYTQGYRDGYRDAMRDAMEMLHKNKAHMDKACSCSGKGDCHPKKKTSDPHRISFFDTKSHGVLGKLLNDSDVHQKVISTMTKGCDCKKCGKTKGIQVKKIKH